MHRVVRGKRRLRDQDLLAPVSLEAGGLDRVKDGLVSMTFLILTRKDIIVLRNSRINGGVDVWRRKA